MQHVYVVMFVCSVFVFREYVARICFHNTPRNIAESTMLMNKLFYPSRYMAEVFKDMPMRTNDDDLDVCLSTSIFLLIVFD